jgi:GTP-binding protein
MKIRSAELKTVCGFTSTLPPSDLPELAFAGRSNVGKSSLINALMQRKRLARVGETPGKTRTINFYEVDALLPLEEVNAVSDPLPGDPVRAPESGAAAKPAPSLFCLVDLPGYGFANVSVAEKQRWGKMIERYLRDPRDLRAVFLLLDIRHVPNANDRQMYDWIINSGHIPVLIATKADKVKRSKVSGQLKVIREGLGAPKGSTILPFSALSGSGREEIWSQISGLVRS